MSQIELTCRMSEFYITSHYITSFFVMGFMRGSRRRSPTKAIECPCVMDMYNPCGINEH